MQLHAYFKVRLQGCGPLRLKNLIIMKLTIAFLLAACLSAGARGYSQSITLSLKNASLETVFKEIRKQTGYDFVFNENVQPKKISITIDIKGADLQGALNKCLEGLPLTYSISDNMIIVRRKVVKGDEPFVAESLPIDVKGRVVDENGEPLEGITVTDKKTGKATFTDIDGSFILRGIDEKSVLIFTGVNVETRQENVSGKDLSFLVLKPRVTPNEAVVIVNTGLVQAPKERLTGSFDHIGNKLFNEQTGANVLDRLPAIGNSVLMGRKGNTGTGQLSIRGLSTIQGPQDPLIIVDNFEYQGDLNNINPNDVESITILKDAAAASIWGARAGNGVVVITTKKGGFNQPVSIDINSNVQFTEKRDLSYVPWMSTSERISIENFLFSQNYRFSDTNSSSRPPFSPVFEILFRGRSGQITQQQVASQISALRDVNVLDELSRHFLRTGVRQQYSLNLHGGTNNISWYVSGGYDKTKSDVGQMSERISLSSINTFNIAKNLQISAGIIFTQANRRSGREDVYNGVLGSQFYQYQQFADLNGNALPVYQDYRQTYIDTAGGGRLLNWRYYPLEDYKYVNKKISTQSIIANATTNYKITSWLSADVKYRFEREQTDTRNHFGAQSYYARDLVNLYTQVNYSSGGQNFYAIPKGGVLYLNNNRLLSHQVRGQLNLSHNWNNHSVAAIAGGEISQVRTEGNDDLIYGYNERINTSGPVDFVNTYPTFITGSPATIPGAQILTNTLHRIVSTFVNASYTFKGRYKASISGRRDASNTFGLNTNDKWTPLWSAGLAWEISKELFYNISFLSYLKLRATYGYSGNLDPSKSAYATIDYQSILSPFTGAPYANLGQFYNPDLRWEKAGMLNIGLDISAFNDRLSGSIEYYRKNNSDLYGPSLIDVTVGLRETSIIKNVANMVANGFDIDLTSVNTLGLIKWKTRLNLSFYKDKITDYYKSTALGNAFLNPNNVAGIVGRPVNSVLSYRWAGLDPATGDPRGYLDDQVSKNYASIMGSGTTLEDLKYHGPARPTVFGSLGNSIEVKNFSLSICIMGKFGYYFRRESINYSDLFAGRQGHRDFAKRWQKPGDESLTNVPSMIYPLTPTTREAFYRDSEVLVEKGDHLRLRYITLGYELTRRHIKKMPFKSIQCYINANDLGIIWRANKNGIDPDYATRSVPEAKNVAIGIKASL